MRVLLNNANESDNGHDWTGRTYSLNRHAQLGVFLHRLNSHLNSSNSSEKKEKQVIIFSMRLIRHYSRIVVPYILMQDAFICKLNTLNQYILKLISFFKLFWTKVRELTMNNSTFEKLMHFTWIQQTVDNVGIHHLKTIGWLSIWRHWPWQKYPITWHRQTKKKENQFPLSWKLCLINWN